MAALPKEVEVVSEVDACSDVTIASVKVGESDVSTTDSDSVTVAKLSHPIFRPGGTLPTVACLSKAALGAAILTMTAHAAHVGLAIHFLGLSVCAVLNFIVVRMVARASIETGKWCFEDICEELLHPAMSTFTGFVNACLGLGSCSGSLIICGQVFQVVTGAGPQYRQYFVLLVGFSFCMPLALAKGVSYLRHLAAWSVASLLLLLPPMLWMLCERGVDDSVTTETLLLGPGDLMPPTIVNWFINVVFAFTCVPIVPKLTGELTPEPSMRRMTAVSTTTMSLCFALFGCLSFCGVLAFGEGVRQRGSLILSFEPVHNHPLVLVALCAVMLSVLTYIPLRVISIRQFPEYLLRKTRRNASDEPRWAGTAISIVTVLIIIGVASVVTNLKTLLNFLGALGAPWLCYVVPSLWYLMACRRQGGFSWWSTRVAWSVALILFGVFLTVFGMASAVYDVVIAC